MATDMYPAGSLNPLESEGSENNFVTNPSRPIHATPEANKSVEASSNKAGRAKRKNKQSQPSLDELGTPSADERSHNASGRKKSSTKKRGQALFPSATRETYPEDAATAKRAAYADDFEGGADRDLRPSPALPSPADSGLQVPHKTPAKHAGEVQKTAPIASDKKSGPKRRRLYSQPVGVIEPASSMSGSQSGDHPPALPFRGRTAPDASSRANESVYDHLIEHSARRATFSGRAGIGAAKVPCGRKSAPARARSIAGAPSVSDPAPAASRPPRRQAAAAAVGRLRDAPSEDETGPGVAEHQSPEENRQSHGGGSQSAERFPEREGDSPADPSASGGSPVPSPDAAVPATEASPPDDDSEQELERGGGEVFFLPTVVRSDDESDDELAEESAGPPVGRAGPTDGACTSDSPAPDCAEVSRGQRFGAAGPSGAPGAAQRRARRQSPPVEPDEALSEGFCDEPAPPRGSGGQRRSEPDRKRSRSSSGPSWMGSERRASARPKHYSRPRAPSPDRSLRRYSYVWGTRPPPRHDHTTAGTKSRSRSRSGSRDRGRGRDSSGPRLSYSRSDRPATRGRASSQRTARRFFTVDPETETTPAENPSPDGTSPSPVVTSASDSVSRHVLVVEPDPCSYRHRPCEIGPNISSESSSTRRQQARSPPSPPRGRAGRQSAASRPWSRPAAGADRSRQRTPPEPDRSRSRRQLDVERAAAPEAYGEYADDGADWAEPELEPEPEPMDTTPPAASHRGHPEQGVSPQPYRPVQSSALRPEHPEQNAAPQSYHPVQSAARQPYHREQSTSPQCGQPPRPQRERSDLRPVPVRSQVTPPAQTPAPVTANPVTVRPDPATRPPVPQQPQPAPRAVPSTPQHGAGTAPPGRQSAPHERRPAALPPGRHSAPGGADGAPIGSELARLVARWRQLARLERQTFEALHAAQRRQREVLNTQQRLHGARLQEGRRARAGILASCDVLERLIASA
ncbi:serine/arginine repetitive matrix protein 2-like [Amphibalanus amphitrite]|uniref:serine/arginine repetitive matrix protein 2-like n=1 Tax=Amphibalanus amphitrite TaxID=1232801 RepID=UPI001C91971E|nr:serine/arginine repetitive matrix protein 2-like [Amphibalanus amphitrite]